MPGKRIVTKVLQRYWRVSRGLTLGAQAVLIDPDDRILLIRHTYRPGWHFPGGGVERGETVETALARELEEEAGVVLTQNPQLFGLYSNAANFPNDHIALFIARSWYQVRVPTPNREIADHRYFARDALPPDLSPGAARRIEEIFEERVRNPLW